MTYDEMERAMEEAGVPILLAPHRAAELARGLGITPYNPGSATILRHNLAEEFARRLTEMEAAA